MFILFWKKFKIFDKYWKNFCWTDFKLFWKKFEKDFLVLEFWIQKKFFVILFFFVNKFWKIFQKTKKRKLHRKNLCVFSFSRWKRKKKQVRSTWVCFFLKESSNNLKKPHPERLLQSSFCRWKKCGPNEIFFFLRNQIFKNLKKLFCTCEKKFSNLFLKKKRKMQKKRITFFKSIQAKFALQLFEQIRIKKNYGNKVVS